MEHTKALRRYRIFLVVAVASFTSLFYFGWTWFHSIPSEQDLKSALESAEEIEIVQFDSGKFTNWHKSADRKLIQSITEKLRYKGRYWQFGPKPANSLMVQTFQNKNRSSVWDVREDGAIYVRKAVRWYRMPIEPGLREVLLQILKERGEPIPKDFPQPAPEDL